MFYTMKYESPIGENLLISDGEHLVGLLLENEKNKYLSQEQYQEKEDDKVLRAAKEWLDCYFAGERPNISVLPIKTEGTDFRKRVWEILTTIPYGKVMTYGEIARIIAKEYHIDKMSAQAVGGAVGHNPIAIIIPCHRVIGTNGSLTGYGGGLERKRWLLQHEGITDLL